MTNSERRQYPRVRMDKPVKLYVEDTGKYLPGETIDVSVGGALLKLANCSRLTAPARVKVGIAMDGRQAIITAQTMMDAVITRNLTHNDVQHVAVCFSKQHTLARTG